MRFVIPINLPKHIHSHAFILTVNINVNVNMLHSMKLIMKQCTFHAKPKFKLLWMLKMITEQSYQNMKCEHMLYAALLEGRTFLLFISQANYYTIMEWNVKYNTCILDILEDTLSWLETYSWKKYVYSFFDETPLVSININRADRKANNFVAINVKKGKENS